MWQMDEETKLTNIEREEYRSRMGSLFYLIKHSKVYISNCVRGLIKVMNEIKDNQVD
jgi:hypothetical protein